MLLIQQYSGVDGHIGVSSPCGAAEVTIWSWVVCVGNNYYTTRWRRRRHYTLNGGCWSRDYCMQQYDFEVDILSMDCHCCFLLLLSAGTLSSSLSIRTTASVDTKAYNMSEISGDFLISFSSRCNVRVDNYTISSEGFGNFHCYHRGK